MRISKAVNRSRALRVGVFVAMVGATVGVLGTPAFAVPPTLTLTGAVRGPTTGGNDITATQPTIVSGVGTAFAQGTTAVEFEYQACANSYTAGAAITGTTGSKI